MACHSKYLYNSQLKSYNFFTRLFFMFYHWKFTFNLATAEELLISQPVLTRVTLECLILLVHICRVTVETTKRNFSTWYICVGYRNFHVLNKEPDDVFGHIFQAYWYYDSCSLLLVWIHSYSDVVHIEEEGYNNL